MFLDQRQYGIRRSITSAYHPHTNGLAERINQTLETRLSKLCNATKTIWPNFLDEVAYSIRTQKQRTTGFTPFRLMFAREHRPLHQEENTFDPEASAQTEGRSTTPEFFEELIELPSSEDIVECVNEQDQRREELHSKREQRVEAAQEKQKAEYRNRKARGVKTFNFCVGMKVLKRNLRNETRKGEKMEQKWTGPYKVLDIDSSNRVALEAVSNGKKLKSRTPYNNLRPFLQSQLHCDRHLLDHRDGLQPSSIQGPVQPSPDTSQLPAELNSLEGQQHCEARLAPSLQREVPLAPAHGNPSEAAREVSIEGKWLTDLHIDHAQHLLGSSFLNVSGFQSTVVFQTAKCVHVKSPINSFVQILHVHNNHWLTVSNLH
ncbi:uncharacterized protein LOC126994097, partial [Eriocheir sinensis]|uniref:uncharacterized protein LOC126994097 n=1 Tax=Eriocheir sinensis TaxID=95602 RepID=UPI0021C9BF73